MPEIQVDPSLLRQMAKLISQVADSLKGSAESIGAALRSAKGYNGQLRSKVYSIAGGDDAEVKAFAEELMRQSDELVRIAKAFEAADSVEVQGRVGLATSIRMMVEDGYDTSMLPWWLIRGRRPPGIDSRIWRHFQDEDKREYLRWLESMWPGFIESGSYCHSSGADTWSAFLVYLFLQGEISRPPSGSVWNSAARASGKSLVELLSDTTGIRQTQVETWLRAAQLHGFSQQYAIHEMAGMSRAGENIEEHFGFNLEGNWTEGDEDEIVEGVLMVSHALARVTPESDTPGEIFEEMFGAPTFTLREQGETNTWYCTAGGYGAQCEPLARGRISSELITHELGHTFNARIANNLGNGLDVHGEDRTEYFRRLQLDPYENLRRSQITAQVGDEVIHVTGQNELGVFERTDHGYASLGPPWQQHSLRWDDHGNTPNEDFADMFLNWAFDGFTDDPAGNARSEWMEEHMPDWITFGTEPFQATWLNGG